MTCLPKQQVGYIIYMHKVSIGLKPKPIKNPAKEIKKEQEQFVLKNYKDLTATQLMQGCNITRHYLFRIMKKFGIKPKSHYEQKKNVQKVFLKRYVRDSITENKIKKETKIKRPPAIYTNKRSLYNLDNY
jgi:hypothetical protein